MKITIIGCWGGFPKAGEATSGYLIEHGEYKLLLECGSGVMSNIQKIVDICDINAVLISHYHYDHFCDLGILQYARLVKTQLGLVNSMLPIYMPDGKDFDDLNNSEYTIGHKFNESSILDIGPFKIKFIKNIHPINSYGIKIICGGKIISFTSDTIYFQDMESFYKNSDLLMCECSFYEGMDAIKSGHMNSIDVGILANNTKSKKVILTHLPHFGDLENLKNEVSKMYNGEIYLAKIFEQFIV